MWSQGINVGLFFLLSLIAVLGPGQLPLRFRGIGCGVGVGVAAAVPVLLMRSHLSDPSIPWRCALATFSLGSVTYATFAGPWICDTNQRLAGARRRHHDGIAGEHGDASRRICVRTPERSTAATPALQPRRSAAGPEHLPRCGHGPGCPERPPAHSPAGVPQFGVLSVPEEGSGHAPGTDCGDQRLRWLPSRHRSSSGCSCPMVVMPRCPQPWRLAQLSPWRRSCPSWHSRLGYQGHMQASRRRSSYAPPSWGFSTTSASSTLDARDSVGRGGRRCVIDVRAGGSCVGLARPCSIWAARLSIASGSTRRKRRRSMKSSASPANGVRPWSRCLA